MIIQQQKNLVIIVRRTVCEMFSKLENIGIYFAHILIITNFTKYLLFKKR